MLLHHPRKTAPLLGLMRCSSCMPYRLLFPVMYNDLIAWLAFGMRGGTLFRLYCVLGFESCFLLIDYLYVCTRVIDTQTKSFRPLKRHESNRRILLQVRRDMPAVLSIRYAQSRDGEQHFPDAIREAPIQTPQTRSQKKFRRRNKPRSHHANA